MTKTSRRGPIRLCSIAAAGLAALAIGAGAATAATWDGQEANAQQTQSNRFQEPNEKGTGPLQEIADRLGPGANNEIVLGG